MTREIQGDMGNHRKQEAAHQGCAHFLGLLTRSAQTGGLRTREKCVASYSGEHSPDQECSLEGSGECGESFFAALSS